MAQPPSRRSDIGALVKELTDRMDKTKSERSQLQESIDQMEMELKQVQEEISEVTRQNESVSCKYNQQLEMTRMFRSFFDQTFYNLFSCSRITAGLSCEARVGDSDRRDRNFILEN